MPTYPAPIVAPGAGAIDWLFAPTRVQRALVDLTQGRFLVDELYTTVGAPGGAVAYDQALGTNAYLDRDVRAIRPGADFPSLTEDRLAAIVAAVDAYGGEVPITRQVINRGDTRAVDRVLVKLSNTIVRKVDAVGVSALAAAPTNIRTAAVGWATATWQQMIADLVAAAGLVENIEAGYDATVVVLNPVNADQLLLAASVASPSIIVAPPQSSTDAIVTNGSVGTITALGLRIFKSLRTAAGTGYVIAGGGQLGELGEEEPLSTNVYEVPRNRTIFVQGWRAVVPMITDPKAATRLVSL